MSIESPFEIGTFTFGGLTQDHAGTPIELLGAEVLPAIRASTAPHA